MKKFMLFATAVGLTLTSCVNDEETTMMGSRSVIAFDAPAMKNARANVLGEINGTMFPEDEDFKVFCKIYQGKYSGWETSTGVKDYFLPTGDVATHEGGTYWSTKDNVYYWPDAGYNLAFAACSPAVLGNACAGTTISRDAAGFKISDFVSEPVSDKQYDLMYSKTSYDRNKNNNGQGAVALQFEHALSSIVFSSHKSDDNADYKIKALKVTGTFYTQGDFTQGIVGTTTGEAYTETETPSWHLDVTSEVEYIPTFNPFNVPSTTPEIFTQGTSAILAIPQNVPLNAYVIVTYDKTTKNNVTTTHEVSIPLLEFKQTTESSSAAVGIDEWLRGKRYVYRIAFGENQRIFFEPEVTKWEQQPTLVYTIK